MGFTRSRVPAPPSRPPYTRRVPWRGVPQPWPQRQVRKIPGIRGRLCCGLAGGTRLTVEQTGFTGVRGFVLAKLIMTPGWKKMVGTTFPAVLADLDDTGALRPDSRLRPKY
jgi:hypothetical protein